MEIILDTANLEEIKKYDEMLEIAGVTTNPSICKKEGVKDFFGHMKEIRLVIGSDKSFHVQVVAQDVDGMLEDAKVILEEVDDQVYIKVPTTPNGLKVMKALKERGVNVTATGIYTKMQAYLAINVGADYLAPYYNRMENQNIDPREAIFEIERLIDRHGSSTKILAASFKNVNQVTSALEHGAHAVTVATDILESALSLPSIQKAVDDFSTDWETLYGEGQSISTLNEIK
ncbi:MAG TPA: fructose-6-phosphate aldolase [Atopostipes sp.]|nr:fructose-6-phosphate aldolase [Atopostipes sp.]